MDVTKKYYIHINNKILGPFTKEELKKFTIRPKTLLWTQDSKIWKKAIEFNELKDIINTTNKTTTPSKSVNYIDKTEKEILKEKYKNPRTHKRKILSGKGRINRIEYLLSLIVFSIGVSFTQSLIEIEGWRFMEILYFFLIWFILAQGSKRCHDYGKSGWLQLIPFYPLYMIIKKGDAEDNEYGPVPR